MIDLFTIGFTQKPARRFFELLRQNGVAELVDTRISNQSQLAGFAKSEDLAFFTEAICHIPYSHNLDFAPEREMMSNYRKGNISWQEYEVAYLNLLDLRKVAHKAAIEKLHRHCLLCSEHSPEFCHRRLLAEYLQAKFNGVNIRHLM
jgi:uncharacterized protein (DUF488 family)